ncbi:MAG TPA: hydrogenase formation protein HypD [Polyangiaceae bacterium]|nr:hydrogenase formation protein HypD [Polyangiaceae bacterium]
MKYVTEFRDRRLAESLIQRIHETVTRPWTLMEVCGGQTHALLRFGIDSMLPKQLELLHGPGCPVCVTPLEAIERALRIAREPNVIFCSFADMLRVPGDSGDLALARAQGANVRLVYSPLDALLLAEQNPDKQVVFFAIGFETTAPANAFAVSEAKRRGLSNFSLLVAHVRVPPALEALLTTPGRSLHGFLAAGHVCSIMGTREYERLSAAHRVPIVVTGFEPIDLLQGILHCVQQLERGRYEVENQYARVVASDGNTTARALMESVFEVVPRRWRGLGEIAESGLGLRAEYASFDAERRFVTDLQAIEEPADCISGLVLAGRKKPTECVHFGKGCSLERPLGATMASSEGACAAYFHYRRGNA